MAPGVGFEPTTDRLTVDCSTAELPRNSACRLAVRAGYNDPLPAVKVFFASPTSVHPVHPSPECGDEGEGLEAEPRIELGYEDLQSSA